jgi:hypothetical protein
MFDRLSNARSDPTQNDEQLLYAHLRSCVGVEPPSLAIERFRCLLLDGEAYPNARIERAIDQILESDAAETEFKNILNRSCYVLINQWQNQVKLQTAIPELIALLEQAKSDLDASLYRSAKAQQLSRFFREFTQTEQYQRLLLLSDKIANKFTQSDCPNDRTLGSSIGRYPSLYEHCLLTSNPSPEQWFELGAMRDRVQCRFEEDLSHYMTAQRSLQPQLCPVKNPTLLSNEQLDFAIDRFTGKVDGSHTYRDLAEQFRTYSKGIRSYRTFKEELYEYLTASLDINYGKGQFDRRLYNHLKEIRSQDNSQKPSEALLLGTYRKLLDFLVVESCQKPEHYIFVDLTANLGIASTIGLLLKLVLLCRQLKSYIEQRFAILFHHYEAKAKNTVGWLVDSLEHFNVASCLHFGKLSHLRV